MTQTQRNSVRQASRGERSPTGSGETRPFTIAPFPATSGNPYLRLFYDALRPHGIVVREDAIFSARWVWTEARVLDALHVHWPEILWGGRREGVLRSITKFYVVLAMARLRGLRLVWTVHNLDTHEPSPRVTQIARSYLARSADLLICHSERTAADVRAHYAPRGEVVVMPHGNYDGVYPHTKTPSAEARRAFGLDEDRPVIACVGRLRDYKGLDVACEAARRLGGAVSLLVAGAPHPGFDVGALAERVRDTSGAVLVPRSLTDAEVALAVRSADLVLLPYRRVTGSGALLTAWTLGRAVIAARLPYFEEVALGADGAAWLYPPGDTEALVEAICEGLGVPASQREAGAWAQAARYDWGHVVRPVQEVLGRWRPRSAGDQVEAPQPASVG